MSRLFKNFHEAFPEVPFIFKPLKPKEFIDSHTRKLRGIRHAAQASTVKYLDNWYNTQPGAIATHYGIDKDGTLYQYFDEEDWGFHTGMGGDYDDNAVGWEHANEMYLKEAGGKFFWQAGGLWKEYFGEVFYSEERFQGYICWAAYTPEQVDTSAKLIAYLCYNHGIPLVFENRWEYLGSSAPLEGILNHSNISTQRSDVGPAYPYAEEEKLAREYFLILCRKYGFPINAEKID